MRRLPMNTGAQFLGLGSVDGGTAVLSVFRAKSRGMGVVTYMAARATRHVQILSVGAVA